MNEKAFMPVEVPVMPPLPDVEHAVAFYTRYTEICRRLIKDEDKAVIKGKEFWKRSAWAKLRREFSISTYVMDEVRVEIGDDWGYKFVVHAELPGGREETSDGMCMSSELEGSNIVPTEHNVRAKALTRAKNRATSDILGAGIVSAEEVETGEAPAPKKKKAEKKHWIETEEAQKRFWAYTKDTLGLTPDEIHEALGVKAVRQFPGTMQEAKEKLDLYADRKRLAGKVPLEEEVEGESG